MYRPLAYAHRLTMAAKLTSLNDDLLLLILVALSQRDLVRASHVCARWRNLVTETPWLWRSGNDYRETVPGVPLDIVVQRSQSADLALRGIDTALHRHVVATSHRVVSLKITITSLEYLPQLESLLVAGLPRLRELHFGRKIEWLSDGVVRDEVTPSVAIALHERNVPSLVELYVFNSHLRLDLVVLPRIERVRIEVADSDANVAVRWLQQSAALRSLVLDSLGGHKLCTRLVSQLTHLDHFAFYDRDGSTDSVDLLALPIRDIECMEDLPIMKLVAGMRKASAHALSLSTSLSSRSTRRGWVVTIQRWEPDFRFPRVRYDQTFGFSVTLTCSLTGVRRTMHYRSVWAGTQASWDRILRIREARTVHLEDGLAWTLFCNRTYGAETRMAQRRTLRLRITLKGGPREGEDSAVFWTVPDKPLALVPVEQLRTLIIRAEPFTTATVIRSDLEQMLKAQFGWNSDTKTKLVLIGLKVREIDLREEELPDWAEDSEEGEGDMLDEPRDEDHEPVQVSQDMREPVPKISGTELVLTYLVLFLVFLYSAGS